MISDLAIFGAYFAIPLVIGFFLSRRRDMPFPFVLWMSAAFILFCGLGHLVEATLFWKPWYRLSGLVKACTAVVSWGTVIALIPVLPKALKLPGMSRLNEALRVEIEERKRAEEQFRRVVEHAPNAMVLVDAGGRISLVNAEALNLFGYARKDLVGHSMERLVPERLRRQHVHDRNAYLEKSAPRAMGKGRDLYALHRSGREIPVEIGLNPVDTREGRCVLASIVDITERHQKEEAVRRTLEQKELFLQELHHRVKNNLQVISSLLNMQARKLPDSQAAAALLDSRQRIHTMAMVHEKLHLEAGQTEIEFGRYLRDLAGSLIQTLEGPTHHVQLEFDTEPVSLEVAVVMPCALLVNELLMNALKHAFPDQRPGQVRIGLHEMAGGRVRLEIRDDGVGFPDDCPWDQPGTLGVELVHSLARQIHAEVEVESGPAVGVGTRFCLVFPRTSREADLERGVPS